MIARQCDLPDVEVTVLPVVVLPVVPVVVDADVVLPVVCVVDEPAKRQTKVAFLASFLYADDDCLRSQSFWKSNLKMPANQG